ncbi:telomeric repeat binding factor 1 [Diplocarpon rosae]|nr:telomeric repeat binding factor 1 [Diplocarpon rosae]
MHLPRENTDIPIKHESPEYPTFNSPDALPLKRLQSDHSQDVGEKRQKLDSTPSANTSMQSPTIADLAAQASEAVMKQFLANQDYTYQAQAELSEPEITQKTQATTDRASTVPAGSVLIADPYLHLRIFSLPILESLSTQILSILAQGPYTETIRIVQDPGSELGQAYATLKSLFDQTKGIYSKGGLFLSADELNIKEPEHRATIRITNLASFSAAVFGSSVGFYELGSPFLDIVTPECACVEKEAGELLVDLKTQMYLSMVTSEEQFETKEDILEEMFPLDFEDLLRKRHPDIPLSDDELGIIELVNGRREFLMKEHTDVESIQALSEKFGWEGFLTSVSNYLKNNYESLLAPYMKRHSLTAPASPRQTPHRNAMASQQNITNGNQITCSTTNSFDQDISIHVQLAADEVLKALGYSSEAQGNAMNPQAQPPSPSSLPNSQDLKYINRVPYPTQSAPTQVLYEKARRAASTKSNNVGVRRPGTPSQRRPWTNEEENTLMAGLDQVKGPHWSQILALYGPNGSLNDVLRDRNQVQLKDKARNLKLFFLKSGIEVPYYLQCVTGELKTRAPSQAAKREAEQRARLAGEDEVMRQEGISALTGMSSQVNGRGATGSLTPEESDYSGGEDFQVVEPEQVSEDAAQVLAPPPPIIEEEHLRQSLMTANAGDADSTI